MKTAFKEWAAVVHALGAGEQALILRKGGIHEKFELLHSSFLFFPTFEHQNEEDLNEQGKAFLRESLNHRARAAALGQDVLVSFYGSVTDEFWIEDFEALRNLDKFHVWSEEGVRKKFNWDGPGLRLFLVRVWKLHEPAVFKWDPAYGGCRSWLEFDREVPVEKSWAVVDERSYESFRAAVTGILNTSQKKEPDIHGSR